MNCQIRLIQSYSGNDTVTCQQSQNSVDWSSRAPTCEPLCPAPRDPPHGTYQCNGNKIGSTCNLSCSSGTRISGEPAMICKENNDGEAYWSNSRGGSCIKQCPQRVIHTPPLMVSCTDGRDVGSVCSFECVDEGQLKGMTSVACREDDNGMAEWVDDFPQCLPRCAGFPSLPGRTVDCTDG